MCSLPNLGGNKMAYNKVVRAARFVSDQIFNAINCLLWLTVTTHDWVFIGHLFLKMYECFKFVFFYLRTLFILSNEKFVCYSFCIVLLPLVLCLSLKNFFEFVGGPLQSLHIVFQLGEKSNQNCTCWWDFISFKSWPRETPA